MSASLTTIPSSRRGGSTWKLGNKLYLFGGDGVNINSVSSILNDI